MGCNFCKRFFFSFQATPQEIDAAKIKESNIGEVINIQNDSKEFYYKPPEKNLTYASKAPKEVYYNNCPLISKGLFNNHNNCYFNSLMQVLAHCPGAASNMQIKPFQNLLQAMITSQGSIQSTLRESLNWLNKNSGFSIGNQHDPKELLQFIIQNSPNIGILFKWKRIIEFSHLNGDHPQAFPSQSYLFFQINPISNNISIVDLKNSFRTFITSEKGVNGYCDKCNSDIKGSERISSSENGNYAIFNTYEMQADCDLNAIQRFNIGKFDFELKFLILRRGNSTKFGHNFAMCKEADWVIYNDCSVNKSTAKIICGVYMMFYEVKQA